MDESYGIEDARITFLEGQYWITYTAVSEHGPAVGLAVTTDFQTPAHRRSALGRATRWYGPRRAVRADSAAPQQRRGPCFPKK